MTPVQEDSRTSVLVMKSCRLLRGRWCFCCHWEEKRAVRGGWWFCCWFFRGGTYRAWYWERDFWRLFWIKEQAARVRVWVVALQRHFFEREKQRNERSLAWRASQRWRKERVAIFEWGERLRGPSAWGTSLSSEGKRGKGEDIFLGWSKEEEGEAKEGCGVDH